MKDRRFITLRAMPPLVTALERAARALEPVIRSLERFNRPVERLFRSRERSVRSAPPRTHVKPQLTVAYDVSPG